MDAGRRARALWLADLALRVAALVLLVGIAVTALHDVSQAWDSGYYHLPFAARLAGVVPPELYVFSAANQGRYDGFPLLGELLQGILWRATGRAAAANLVSFASVPVLAWFMRRRFAVPAHLTVLATLAVPLVMTHASSTYVDLPANVAVSVVLMLAIEAWAVKGEVGWATIVIAVIAAAVAGTMKVLVEPVAIAGLIAIGARTAVSRQPSAVSRQPSAVSRQRIRKLGALALGLPLALLVPIKNLLLRRNPFYPVEMRILGVHLPGNDTPYSSSPDWLDHAPQPVRFACSLLEIGVRPFTNEDRWTVDQWMPPGSDGARMGGFFNAYVILNLVLLAARAVREKDGPARRAAGAFLALTVATSFMPQSHELRYYLHWMLVLVALNLWLACREGAPRAPGPIALGLGAALTCAIVIHVTGGNWVRPTGSTFSELLRKKVDPSAVARIAPAERVCVRRPPWTILWAAPFHGAKRYAVVEAERASDCVGAPELP